ncbi:MAG: universal stress protein [Anaerolineales bacterium]|nr:universal stress protein [Anaerolineales bacterium]
MEILLVSDGSTTARKNAQILSQFQFPEGAVYVVVRVGEEQRRKKGGAHDLTGLQQALDRMECSYQVLSHKVADDEALLSLINERGSDLVVDLRKRQRGTAFRFGQISSKLAQEIETTLLLAHPAPAALKKILLCSGGEVPSEITIRVAANWLKYTSAAVHLLHVMSQVALDVAHPSEDLTIDARDAIEFDTREGVHLKRGIQWLRDAGIHGEVVPVLRHGLVLDEIMAELEEGNYDMVVVGAHIRGKSRLLNLLLEDITDKLITRIRTPFLIARINPSDHVQQSFEAGAK